MARKNKQADGEGQATDQVSVNEPKERKSIVPAKYAGKYSKGGSDVLAEFINGQCTGKDGFEFTAFFQLCRMNGLPEEQVAKYEQAVADKAHGANGRARMTLRNMLGTIARKTGKLQGLNGQEQEVSLPARAPSGAAAKAQEQVAA
jgi:hypothetical protein